MNKPILILNTVAFIISLTAAAIFVGQQHFTAALIEVSLAGLNAWCIDVNLKRKR